MELVTEVERGMWVVKVTGAVDFHTRDDFRKCLFEGISCGHSQVVADLERTTFIDSTGLGILIEVLKHLKKHGGMVYVVAPTTNIRKIFEITALDRVFDIHDNLTLI